VALLQIIGVNIILSGDNALVIALACRELPPRQQKIGIFFGAGAAVILRIIFSIFIVFLMTVPFLKIAGGLLLFWIAYKLLVPGDEQGEDSVKASGSMLAAVRTVLIADAVMSLDNVIAVAAAAKGNTVLLVLGLAISIPLVVFGATLMIALIKRMPFIVTLGAALIGYIAGEVIVTDPGVQPWVDAEAHWLHVVAPLLGAVLVLDVGWLLAPASVRGHEPAGVTEGTAAPVAVFGLRFLSIWLGQFVLSRAPLIVSFLAGLLGYTGAQIMVEGDAALAEAGVRSVMHLIGPLIGAAIGLGIAEGLARIFWRGGVPNARR
jgi:YjbE family integral membrane protein